MGEHDADGLLVVSKNVTLAFLFSFILYVAGFAYWLAGVKSTQDRIVDDLRGLPGRVILLEEKVKHNEGTLRDLRLRR